MKINSLCILILFINCLSCRQAEIPMETFCQLPDQYDANIVVPSQLGAGDALTITIITENILDQTNLELVIGKRYSDQIIPIEIIDSKAKIEIDYNLSGHMNFQLMCGPNEIANASCKIMASSADGKVKSFNGPKSLVINDDVESMLVVLPTDQYGNPLEDDRILSFSKQFGNNSKEKITRPTSNLVAYNNTSSQKNVAKILLGASIENAFVVEQEVKIEASLPSSIVIKSSEYNEYADARQNIQIETLAIKDHAGNVVADGTAINFIIAENNLKKAVYNSFTINGIAKVLIQNPSSSTNWSIFAQSIGVASSNKLNFSFKTFIDDFELKYKQEKGILTVGPISTKLGQLISDGLTVKASFIDDQKTIKLFAESLDGYAEFELPKSSLQNETIICVVEISGIKKSLKINH